MLTVYCPPQAALCLLVSLLCPQASPAGPVAQLPLLADALGRGPGLGHLSSRFVDAAPLFLCPVPLAASPLGVIKAVTFGLGKQFPTGFLCSIMRRAVLWAPSRNSPAASPRQWMMPRVILTAAVPWLGGCKASPGPGGWRLQEHPGFFPWLGRGRGRRKGP